jgi:hypothetical protein
MLRRFSIAVAAAAVMSAAVALAQPATPKQATESTAQVSAAMPDGGIPQFIRAETPEQRKGRLGTAEDPGLNPDPNKHYWRYGKSYHITKYERRFAIYDASDANYVRPMGLVNFAYEIYQQNERYVWCWMPDPDIPEMEKAQKELPATVAHYSEKDLAFFAKIRSQFTELNPPASDKSVSFAESSDGLPQTGSWRNSLAVADMNDDGCPDLIAPPERKGAGLPVIFLGDCKGHWRTWNEVTWPHGIDYGGVVAADFNKDGKIDLAFAVHLNGLYVFLGDGKGHFTESAEGLPRNFPTRRVVAADVDGDGWLDIVAISEGPDALDSKSGGGGIRAYLNRNKGMAWEMATVIDPSIQIGGDWLSVGNLNADRVLDVIASSVYFNGTTVANLSEGPKKWKFLLTDGDVIPVHAYFLANTIGKFERAKDEAILSSVRYWPTDLDTRLVATPPLLEVTSVDRYVFGSEGLGVKRIPIMRWGGHVGVHGLSTGDFDGDGNLDMIFTSEEAGRRELVILLGDGKGNFKRARVDGLKLEENGLYDVKVADVNGDGKPDVILMYEVFDVRRDDFMRVAVMNQPGSIKVFLNRGAKSAPQAIKAAK